MRKFFLQAIYVIVIASVITSCSSKGPKEAVLIPKDAVFVSAMDAGSLQDKLKVLNINVDSIIDKVFENDSAKAKHKQLVKDFKECGIDWNAKFFVFATNKKLSDNMQGMSVNLITPLKDSAKLLAFIRKADELKDRKVIHEKKYSYLQLNNSSIISWTDKNIIATYYHYTETKSWKMDSVMHTGQPSIDKVDELKRQVNTYYTQAETESLASLQIFTDLFKEKADAYAFSTTNSSLSALSAMPFQIPKLTELLQDNYSTSTFSFDEGKITAKANFFPNKTLSAIFKKYTGATVNTSMIENYPSQNINGLMLLSFNPEIFDGIMKELDVDALVNGYLEKANITTADLYKCLKGDIAVAVSDLNLDNFRENKTDSKAPYMKMVFNAAIGDRASFNKIMDKAAESGFVVKEKNTYKSSSLMQVFGIYMHVDDKNMIVASDSLTYAQYVSKSSKANISADVMSQIKGKSAAMYVNIETVIESFKTNKMSAGDSSTFTNAKATFKDMIATSSNYDGSKIASEMSLRLKNEKQNSLVTLLSLFTNISNRIVKNHQKDDSFEHFLLLDPSMGNF